MGGGTAVGLNFDSEVIAQWLKVELFAKGPCWTFGALVDNLESRGYGDASPQAVLEALKILLRENAVTIQAEPIRDPRGQVLSVNDRWNFRWNISFKGVVLN